MKRTMRTIAVAAMSVIVALTASCGDGDDDSAATTSTTIDGEVEAEVLAAYEAGWRAFEEAATSNPVNPDHPALAETMTESSLANAIENLQEWAAAGVYVGGPPTVLHPEVTALEGDTARIVDCPEDRAVLYNADSTVNSAATEASVRADTTMVRMDGAWKRAVIATGEEACQP